MDRQQAYVLYLNGHGQACVDNGADTLERNRQDTQTRLSMASAQFELGDCEAGLTASTE